MSIYGSRESTPFTGSNSWACNVPAGLAGHRQFLCVMYGLGASYAPTTPSGWTQWAAYGHTQEDVSLRIYTRVLAADYQAGTVAVGFTGSVPGVSFAESWADVELIEPGSSDESGFATTYTPPTVQAQADGWRVDFVARKDARSLVSWPNMSGVIDRYVGASNSVSGSVGHESVVAGNTSGELVTIQDAFESGFDTAPFASLTLRLRSTGTTTQPGTVTASGGGQLPLDVDVATVELSNPASFAVGATRDVVVTVTGSDGSPVEGVDVTAIAPSVASVDQATKTTNSIGQVTFTLTGLFAGERQFSVSSGGVSAQTSIVVTGAETVIDALDDVMTAGNQTTITVTATDAAGNPIANAAVSFAFSGVSVTPVTQNAITNTLGVLAYVIQADTAGQFTARATVSGTQSLPVTVTVNPVISDPAGTIRLRGEDYQRTNPVKR